MSGKRNIFRFIAALAALLSVLCCVAASLGEDIRPYGGDGVLGQAEFEQVGLSGGFAAALPSGGGFRIYYPDERTAAAVKGSGGGPGSVYVDITVGELPVYAEDAGAAERIYDGTDLLDAQILHTESFELDGHPGRYVLVRASGGNGDYSIGFIFYARNRTMLRARVFSEPAEGTEWEELPKASLTDLQALAERIVYDPSPEDTAEADGALTAEPKNGSDILTAGKKTQFTYSFLYPDRVKEYDRKLKPDAVSWAVTDTATGEAPDGVTINRNGLLSADRGIQEAREVTVTVSSDFFHTSATYDITVLPAATKMRTEPAEVFLYSGSSEGAEVKAVLEPETVPPLGITWKASREGIVEVIPGDGGTVTLFPKAAGKISVTATEPGGRKASVRVSVAEPVTDLQLTVSGRQIPGGTVNVRADIIPRNAGNRKLEWSVDAGGDIAVIADGRVRISKDAPEGTVITVTCTAVGADEPVVRTVQITVGHK